jgi:hypothetical protein
MCEITENVRTVAEGMTEELGGDFERTKESKPMGSRGGVAKGRRV